MLNDSPSQLGLVHVPDCGQATTFTPLILQVAIISCPHCGSIKRHGTRR